MYYRGIFLKQKVLSCSILKNEYQKHKVIAKQECNNMSTRYLSVRACNSIFSEYPDVVGIKEICKMLGIGKDKAYELVKNGELRKIPCSRSVKVPKISVIEYILRCM